MIDLQPCNHITGGGQCLSIEPFGEDRLDALIAEAAEAEHTPAGRFQTIGFEGLTEMAQTETGTIRLL